MPTSDSSVPTQSEQELTQLNYKGSPYQDQSWEVVGEISDEREFVPMQIEVLPQDSFQIDKMFADYGGRTPEDTRTLWHLPEGVGYQKGEDGQEGTEGSEEPLKSFTETELAALLEEAEQRGRDKAQAELIERQNEKLGQIESSLQSIMLDLQKQVEELHQKTEKDAAALAVAISEKIMHHSVEVHPEYVSKILQEAISLSGSATIQKIRVSPQDMEFIELVGVGKKLKEKASKWKFEGDPTVRAGCIVETSAGEIDFQLEKAFERVRESIIRVINE